MLGFAQALVGKTAHLGYLLRAEAILLHQPAVGPVGGELPVAVGTSAGERILLG